jgi:outer membrane receptor protein involved in Fe transport
MSVSSLLRATALVGVLAGIPSVAFAQVESTSQSPSSTGEAEQDAAGQKSEQQNAPDTSDSNAQPPAQADIVVTGSRISRPNDTSISPITTISGAELQQTGRVSTGDVLNDLPALQSTFSQANSTRFLGTAGLNLLDLRGLGTQRTLVLVNGRRHVGSDILNFGVSPDVNTIPTDLIDRVDVVTGGNSAVYGSDAIAGVVNFVLKDHFSGVQVHAQGGVSKYGDAGSYYASVLAGHNFAGGRGNIALDVEYARQNRFYAADRPYLAHNNGFVAVDADPAGSLNGSDGNPDNIFFRDIRSATTNEGGLIAFASPTGACGRDTQLQSTGLGRPFTCNYIFTADGTLVPETGTRVGLSSGSSASPTSTPGGAFIGGNGSTRRSGELVQIQPRLDRYSANLVAHFDIADALVPFVEATYSRTDSIGQGSGGPAFITGTTLGDPSATVLGGPNRETIRLDNPFLSAQARGVITSALIAGGRDPAAVTGATRVPLRELLTGLGSRTEEARRETYRIVAGLRGTFNGNWRYELSGNYGEFDEHTRIMGNLNAQRFLLALDSTRNAAGQIVCRSQVDPSAQVGYVDTSGSPDGSGYLNRNNPILAADIAACQPFNPFGRGNVSQGVRDYVVSNTVSTGKISQLVGSGFISGDTGGFFNLPGGPVGFAVGAEYRRETNSFREDPLVGAGYTFYNSIPTFKAPAFEVKEAYGELRIPILKDLPFAEDLTVTGAGRVAHYRGSTGTVYAYNAGAEWAPVRDIRFRGNYSRSVRAPNLQELYFPLTQNFAPNFTDPCSADQIGQGSSNRAANCRAAGIPTTYNFSYAQSLETQAGGNPNLNAEKSDSFTYGVVLQPRFIPGLTLSLDYYDIKVKNVIQAIDAQTIANLCYDSSTTSNPFCALFKRAGSGGASSGEQPFQIIEGSLLQVPLNFASLQARGLDLDVRYARRIGAVSLSSHLVYTHQLQNQQNVDPTDPSFGDRIMGELGSPKDAFNLNNSLDFGEFFVNYQLRYISKMSISAYEDQHTFQGRPPQNADVSDILYFPHVFYHDVRVGLNVGERSNFYLGVDNVTNRRPPLGSTGLQASLIGASNGTGGTGIYEPVGRRFYAGVSTRF